MVLLPKTVGKKFYLTTFGCRTNQADSAAVRQDFLDREFEETQCSTSADVIVVNSCTVTHRSDQQVRQLTRKLRRDNPRARLIVTGCYAQRSPETLAAIPGVDAVVGNSHKNQIAQVATARVLLPSVEQMAAIYQDDFSRLATLDMMPAAQTGGKTRPFVKIQDGCDAKCTYCIIPLVRGPSRSAPPEQVLRQVKNLVEEGFKEIVLTGIHIGTYGMRFQPRCPLDRLLEEIVAIAGLERLRLSSVEPMQLSRRITSLAAGSPKITPHFHVCLQSGSDRILKKMLRPYTTKRFADIVGEIRERIPEAAIGTDVIAGFPGETEEDHRQTVEFVEKMPFTYLHVFPYSDRSGTPASRMKEKVAPRILKERSEELRQLSEEKNRHFRRRFLGWELSVLTLAEEKNGMRTAISGNYLRVKLSPSVPANEIVRGRVGMEDEEGFLIFE